MANVHLEQGRTEGAVQALWKALLTLLREPFGKVPRAVERAVNATDDLARREAWVARFGTATTLAEGGIESER
jgi:hypothetical protein